MSSRTVREVLLADIAADIPQGWKRVAGLWQVTDTRVPVLWIEYSALNPAAASPAAAVDVTVDLCMVTQYTDLDRAEDEADENVLVLYGALLRSQIVTQVSASKTVWEDRYLGWRVSATVTLPIDTFTNPADVPDED